MILEPKLTVDEAQKNLDLAAAVVTDCKALYDLLQRDGIQSSFDKRVAIEGLVIKDLLKQLRAQLRWVSSERQVSDGMTKLSTRQQMVDVLKSGYIQLIADETFQAAKKKTAAARESSRLATTSKIAATTVALVTAETLKGSANAGGSYIDNFVFVLTVLIMLAIPMTLGLLPWCPTWTSTWTTWTWWTTSTSSSTTPSSTSTPMTEDKEIQTAINGYEMQTLWEQYVEADERLDAYKQEIIDLQALVEHYEQTECETFAEMEAMRKVEFELRRLVEAPLFHTIYGGEYHRKRDCSTLYRTIEHLTPCKVCRTFSPRCQVHAVTWGYRHGCVAAAAISTQGWVGSSPRCTEPK